MKRAPRAPLPKLSYGEGSMFYNKDGDVVYKKMMCGIDGSRVRRTVTGSTAIECLNLMAEKEKELLINIESPIKKTAFKEEIYYWLENVKKNTLKRQSCPDTDTEMLLLQTCIWAFGSANCWHCDGGMYISIKAMSS